MFTQQNEPSENTSSLHDILSGMWQTPGYYANQTQVPSDGHNSNQKSSKLSDLLKNLDRASAGELHLDIVKYSFILHRHRSTSTFRKFGISAETPDLRIKHKKYGFWFAQYFTRKDKLRDSSSWSSKTH